MCHSRPTLGRDILSPIYSSSLKLDLIERSIAEKANEDFEEREFHSSFMLFLHVNLNGKVETLIEY